MGRLTQAFDYINKDPKKMNSEHQKELTHITITDGLKKERRKHLKERKE